MDWPQPGQEHRKCLWPMLWPFLLLLMPSLVRTRITHPAACPSSPCSLVPPTPLKDATSPTSTVSQRLSSQVFQDEGQNLMPPQVFHLSMLNQALLSQLLSPPLHICTAGHAWCHTSPAHLQSNEKGSDGTDSTMHPALQGASTPWHTAAALQVGDLDMSCYTSSTLSTNMGDGLQSPVKLIPQVLESWSCSFKCSSAYQL